MKTLKATVVSLMITSILATGSFSTFADNNQAVTNGTGASVNPDHITLTWSGDPATTQTITWRASTSAGAGSVSFKKANDIKGAFVTKAAAIKKFSAVQGDASGEMNLYSVTLTGLTAGTRYTYVVKNGGVSSSQLTFTTEAKKVDNFKFLIFGDSQSGDVKNPDYAPFKKDIHNAFNQNKDAKFLINVGDLVENGQSYNHWNNWFDAAKGVIDTIPEMPVQGNHETYNPTEDFDSAKPVYYLDQFNVFKNGPDSLKGQVYSYDYGNVHFAVLDSQEDEESPKYGDILNSQAQWLDKDLAATKQQWKVVLFHKTPYYNKAARANETVKNVFTPVFDKYHVDVVFNGHDHGVSRTYPIKNGKFYSSPKDGTVYYVTGRSGAKYYNDLSSKVWDAFFYDPQDQPCYETVQVNGAKLTITARKSDGTVIDTYTIDKANYANSTITTAPGKYNVTRVAVYGSLLGGQTINAPSAQKNTNDEWFIDINAFMTYIGGTVTSTNDKTTLHLGGKDYDIPADKVVINTNKVVTVSAEAIKSLLGYSYNYDSGLNVIFFAK